jgi:polyisoprenoid-binding protein YceI
MMMKRWILAVGIALAAAVAVSALAAGESTWQIDPAHSNAQFVVRHMGISNVQGDFTKISGAVEYDEKDVAKSSVNATIDVASIDTRVEGRDKDLKSANWFDVDKYPTITFHSKKAWKEGDGLKVSGDLTIHGVTKEVTLDVTGPTAAVKDPWGNSRRGLSAAIKVNRQDFGLVFAGKTPGGDAVVGDNVAITLDVEIVQK